MGLALVCLCLPAGVWAQTEATLGTDPARFFASCAGRLSAELEFAWLLSHPSEQIDSERQSLLDILDSLGTPDRGPEVLSWQINAKMAHAALLTRQHFGADAEDADWAAETATHHRLACTEMLLG